MRNKLQTILKLAALVTVIVILAGCDIMHDPFLASYLPARYSVTYDGNGSTSGTVPIDVTSYLSGQNVTVLGNPGNLGCPGFNFTGWNTAQNGTGNQFSPGQVFPLSSMDLILYAAWTADPTYHVIYNANGAASGSVPTDNTAYLSGQVVVVQNNSGGLLRPNYTFLGWNTDADGSGTLYASGQTFSMGSTDVTLFAHWMGTGPDNNVTSLAIQPDGRIIIGGNFHNYNDLSRNHIARLNADGGLDNSFLPGDGPSDGVSSIVIQNDGRVVIGGGFDQYAGATVNGITRLQSFASRDITFNPGTGLGSSGAATCLAVMSDSRIVIGGGFYAYNGISRYMIARTFSDGSIDSTFLPGGNGAGAPVLSLALQSDGRIIIGGGFTDYRSYPINRLARLNIDGSLDSAFNPGNGANNLISALNLLVDGKIIIAGQFTAYDGTPANYLARINQNGSADTGFGGGTRANANIRALAIQTNGQIIIAGDFTYYNGTERHDIARLNADGTLDGTFNAGTGASGSISAVAIQSDGKILAGGSFSAFSGQGRRFLIRLNSDGSIDNTFNH